jgi:hypothetical protein
LADAMTHGTTLTGAHWYGERARRIQITSAAAVWDHAGKPVVPIRGVLLRDPEGRFEPQALLTTTQQLAPAQVLTSFLRRWHMEATCEDARAHLGIETPRQWSDQAMARTTPVVLALYSIVTVIAAHRLGTNTIPVRTAAW